MKSFALLAALLSLVLTALACAPAAPPATPQPTPATRPASTAAPTVAIPSPSPTPQPTATPYPTPTPWVTRMPTFTPRWPPAPTPDYYPYTPIPPTATPRPTPTFAWPSTATPDPAYYETATPRFTPTPAATVDKTSTCSRFPDKAHLFREHDAIDWQECPVIENGVLRASGTATGGRALLNHGSIATFVIKYRNSDRDALVILRPALSGESYPNKPGTAVATHWEVSSQSFSIRVPVGNLDSPVDLLVWGSDIRSVYVNAPPLAIRSIGYIR